LVRSLAPEAATPEASVQPAARRRVSTADAVGAGLVAAAIASVLVSAADDGGAPGPTALLLLGSLVTYLLSLAISRRVRWLVPVIVLLAAGGVAVTNTSALFERSPFVVPFGYAHFMWAFFLQAGLAGVMLAVLKAPLPLRVAGATVGLAFGLVAFGGSVLGPLVLGAILVMALIVRRGWARAGVIAAAAVFLGAVVASVVLGATYSGLERWGSPNMLLEATSNRCDTGPGCSLSEAEGLDRVVFSAVSERRVALWHDAFILMRDHPVTGVGPGLFQAKSPLALGDRDEPWAHHEFLHFGAEAGAPGMLLLLVLFVWAFARLFRSEMTDGATLIAATAVAALGMHACLDYVLHHPAAPLVMAALVGAGAAGRRSPEAAA
jgi:O-antigen ligase